MNSMVKALVQSIAAATQRLSLLLSASASEKRDDTDTIHTLSAEDTLPEQFSIPQKQDSESTIPTLIQEELQNEREEDASLVVPPASQPDTEEYIPQSATNPSVPFSPKHHDIEISVRHIMLIIFFILSSWTGVQAQDSTITTKLDTNALLIGDQTKLYFQVRHPAKASVRWPGVPDTLGKMEVVGRRIDTLSSANAREMTERQSLTITAFNAGSYSIPSFPILIIGAKGDTQTVMTNSFLLTVHTIPVDTTQAIKDVKAPLDVPFSWREWLPYIMDIVLIAAGITAFYYYMKKRKKKLPEYKPLPSQPAHEIALEALRRLEEEKLWQNGFVKQYYSSLSMIIRAYIEDRYGIGALESTTDEILAGSRSLGLSGENRERLQQLLILADLVKFAKEQPLPDEHSMSMKNAYTFVESTILRHDEERGGEGV